MTTYNLKIEQDSDAMNPLTDFDGQPLVIVLDRDYGRASLSFYEDGKRYTDSQSSVVSHLPDLTRRQVIDNLPAIVSTIMGEPSSVLQWLRYTDYETDQGIVYHVNDYMLEEMVSEASANDVLDVLESIYTMAGITTYQHCETGYSQGDYVECLVVAEPSWIKAMGITQTGEALQNNLKATAETYSSWALGDCYGYIINKPVTCECCDNTDDEEVDSCWGFYGSDHDKSGLIDNAKSNLAEGDILLLDGEPV